MASRLVVRTLPLLLAGALFVAHGYSRVCQPYCRSRGPCIQVCRYQFSPPVQTQPTPVQGRCAPGQWCIY